MANLVSLERVHKAYGIRPLLDDVSLGVGAGERIGVVGRNGDGKTTLLRVLAGLEEPDEGRVARNRGLRLGFLTQGDDLDPGTTVRQAVLGDRADHEWAADATTRETVEVLLAGVSLDRSVDGLSGGERRRCSLARLLLGDHDLVVLDEPTNHLDVEAVAWLARHLVRRTSALGGRHPRPVVPRRGLRADLGGARRRRGRVRRRLRGVRARQGGAAAAGGGVRGAAAEPDAQGARLAAPWRAGPDQQAEVPHRRGDRADRGRAAAARPAGSCNSSRPSGSARTSSTSRTSTSSGGSGRCSRTPPGGSDPATGSAWSG